MNIALFEDQFVPNFYPFTLTKPIFDLKLGAMSVFEEYQARLSNSNNHRNTEHFETKDLFVRDYLAQITKERHPKNNVNPASIDSDIVLINGLVRPSDFDALDIGKRSGTFIIKAGQRILAARLSKNGFQHFASWICSLPSITSPKSNKRDILSLLPNFAKLNANDEFSVGLDFRGAFTRPWEIIMDLHNSLSSQGYLVTSGKNDEAPGVKVLGKAHNRLAIAKGSKIEEATVLDLRNGPIVIGPDAYLAQSRIVGPSYIGSKVQIKQFSIIEESYVGNECRIGGEVEQSIISDYTNKAHDGFLGHSYSGEWINFGAMTTTSDLKMTYGNIKMDIPGKGKKKMNLNKIDTGMNKLGSFFGDMVKTSIGTLIFSGRRIGISSHLYGAVARDVPSFTIFGRGIGARNVELQIESAIETQRRMMARRGISMSKSYEKMVRDAFTITSGERIRNNVTKGRFLL